jgi:HlyD family secretion protein
LNAKESAGSASVSTTLGLDSPGGSRRKSRFVWILIGVTIVAVGWVFLPGDRDESVQYETTEIQRGPLQVIVTATGTLQPTNQVEIGSEVSGEIEEIFVDFNDLVSRGQIIARMDTEQLEARLASTRAALAVAEASLIQAEATAEEAGARTNRSAELADNNLISQQSLETDVAAAKRAVAAVASAQAQVTSARASVQESETSLRKAEIRSPIDGMVLSRQIDPGQTLAAAFQTPVLFKLAANLVSMELRLDIDESDIGLVEEGQRAIFRVDAYPGKEFDAEIASVHFDPRTVNNIVTYEAVLSVSNPDLLLRPGMTATADAIIAENQNVVLIPNRALRFLPPDEADTAEIPDDGSSHVWIVRNGKLVSVAVDLGLSNDEFTELLGGDLPAGAEVVIDIQRERRTQGQGGGGPFG